MEAPARQETKQKECVIGKVGVYFFTGGGENIYFGMGRIC